ncbi:hypothetical protein MTO96_045498, partial [Rhipicephalus appendiculatus]
VAAGVAPPEIAPRDWSAAKAIIHVVCWFLLSGLCTSLHTVLVSFIHGGRSARHGEPHYGFVSAASGSSDAASSAEPDTSTLIRLTQHRKRAYDLISKALK